MTSIYGISTNTVSKIYNSRTNILKYAAGLDYNVSNYQGFSINEIDAMYCNSQLDMLIPHNAEEKKIYIKYYFVSTETKKSATTNINTKTSRQISKQNLTNIIEDLYEIENVLTKKDTLIVIIDEEPNDTILNLITYLYEKDGIFIVIHNIKRLQFDLLSHSLVPEVKILTEDETTSLMVELNIHSLKQFPEISRFDPVSLAIMLRPNQVVLFQRKSPTALESSYYRVCV